MWNVKGARPTLHFNERFSREFDDVFLFGDIDSPCFETQIVTPRHSDKREINLGLKPKAVAKCRSATIQSPRLFTITKQYGFSPSHLSFVNDIAILPSTWFARKLPSSNQNRNNNCPTYSPPERNPSKLRRHGLRFDFLQRPFKRTRKQT